MKGVQRGRERYGGDGDLTLCDYKQLGGLEGSVQRSADGVMKARALEPHEIRAVREAFLTMTRINEQGQYTRTPSRWEATSPSVEEVLRRFVEARLLISGKENGTIEVAHEALLRTWPLLKSWLEESKEFLLWHSRIETAIAEQKRSGTLLTGKPLLEAERWRERTAVETPERKLIDASLKARKWQRRRNRVAGASGVAILLGFTGGLWWQLHSLQRLQQQAFEKELLQLMSLNPLESVVNGVAALSHHMERPGMNHQLSMTLAKAMQNNWAVSRMPIDTGQGWVRSLIELKNGELISGGSDGTLLFLSPQRVAKKACQEELSVLLSNPEDNPADKKAEAFCEKLLRN
ncbi:MAG: hypothetical protein CL859_09800 [Cyanobium sp. ARS6]|nr:hypothetical protein [Cyanobium sp. ARS6]